MMEVIRAQSERENIVGALADHILYEEHLAEEYLLTSAERTVIVSQATLKVCFASVSQLIKNVVNSLVTPQDAV